MFYTHSISDKTVCKIEEKLNLLFNKIYIRCILRDN